MTLSKRDLDLLQEATLELHAPRDLEGLRDVAPKVFKSVIPADFFAWIEGGFGRIDDPRGDFLHWESPVRTPRPLLRKLVSLSHQHPFTQHVVRTGDLGPLRLSDFWTRRQQLASPLHREVYRHVGVGRMLAIATVRGHRGGTLTLCRPLDARDFSERDRTLLRLLAPHFTLALAAAEVLSARHAAHGRALDGLGLTPREAGVALWLAHGRTNGEIATILAMKPRTVEKHVENILSKLGVENRTAAACVILGAATVGSEAAGPADPARSRETLRRVLRASPRGAPSSRKRGTGS